MSLERTLPPTSNIPPPLPVAAINIEPSGCHVCNDIMKEGQDCLILNECSHAYHRQCIESYLSSSSECPVCKKYCQLSELRKLNIVSNILPLANTNTKSKGRGAVPKPYNTRSTIRNLFSNSQNDNSRNSKGPAENLSTPNRENRTSVANNVVNSPLHNNPHPTPPRERDVNGIDFEEINRLIETNIRLLTNLNIIPTNNTTENVNRPTQTNDTTSHQVHILDTPNHFSNSSSNVLTIYANKVTSAIQNWNLKFDGSSSGLTVEEFLYRVRSLTHDTLNRDFSHVCRNLNILLIGKARDWYWRYHKQVGRIEWSDFCDALKCQYRDFKSSFDIREEIRNRRQKLGETFDTYYEAVSAVMDRLPSPMNESELIEILIRNLRPDIRQELLYVSITSISQLRKMVQKREHFLSDEYVRKNLVSRNTNSLLPRRFVNEVDDIKEEVLVDENENNII